MGLWYSHPPAQKRLRFVAKRGDVPRHSLYISCLLVFWGCWFRGLCCVGCCVLVVFVVLRSLGFPPPVSVGRRLPGELRLVGLCCPSISGTGPSYLGHTAVALLTGYLAAASGGLDLGAGRGAVSGTVAGVVVERLWLW